MKFRNLISTTFIFSLLMSGNSLASGGLTGWYQSNGASTQTSYNQGTYNTSQNYNNVGVRSYNGYTQSNNNYKNPTGGGLTAYYAANNFPRPSITYQPPAPTLTNGNGGFTQYFSTNLQANTFASQCNSVARPNPTTCQGGSYQEIKNNYGCTIDWRCEGGNFCPVVERPLASQCNGIWKAQHNAATQCLTHYFCDHSLNPVTQVVIESFNGPNNLEVNQSGTWAIRVRDGSSAHLSYSIDWGERNYVAAGQYPQRFSTQKTTFSHQYANTGTYTVRITVSNQNGQQATSQKIVRVTGERPSVGTAPVVRGISGPTTLITGQTGTWRVRASDRNNGNLSYHINWGDEMYGAQARYGRDGYVQSSVFTHYYNEAGTYTVSVIIRNDSGQTARTSTTVRVGRDRVYEPQHLPQPYEPWLENTNDYRSSYDYDGGNRHSIFNRSYGGRGNSE